MKEEELKKLQKKTLAQVCDGMAKVSKGFAKDANSKKQKEEMIKHAEHFKALGKIFRSLNKKK